MSSRFKIAKIGGNKSTDKERQEPEVPLIVAFYDPEIQAQDARHRTLEEILEWPDSELERCHNYIQMLFPVPEGSMFNWEAPVIDRKVMEAFRSRAELREQLQKSFQRMLTFYGFAVAGNKEAEKATDKSDDDMEDEKLVEADGTGASQNAQNDEQTTLEGSKDGTTTTTQPTAPQDIQPQLSTTNNYTIIRGPNWSRNSRNWAVRFDHNHLRITRILRCLRVLGLQQQCDAFYAALQHVFVDPAIRINERSMIYWKRAATRSLYIAPDDDKIEWLKEWQQEREVKAEEEEKA